MNMSQLTDKDGYQRGYVARHPMLLVKRVGQRGEYPMTSIGVSRRRGNVSYSTMGKGEKENPRGARAKILTRPRASLHESRVWHLPPRAASVHIKPLSA